jgi:phosphatidate cytidylyltransferase
MTERYWQLLISSTVVVFILLLIATLISIFLKTKNPHNQTLQKVFSIVRSWWFLATPALAALILGPIALMVLFFIITCFALVELTKFSKLQGLRNVLLGLFFVITVLQYATIYFGSLDLFYSLILLLAVWIIPILIILRADVKELPNLGALILACLLVIYYLSHVPALSAIRPALWQNQAQASLAILLLIFTTETNDIFQFLAGKAFGRTKLFPQISPNKTEAGFVGGIIGTLILFFYFGPVLLEISVGQSVLLGVCISLTGIFGDLLFSSIKRYYTVKDFSDLIPGHGGLLDRVDSLILTAPVYFHLIYYFKTGAP